MTKNAPLFTCFTSVLLLIFGILEMIATIKGLNTLDTLSGDYFDKVRGALIFELIVAIFVCLSSVISFLLAVNSAEDKHLYGSTAASFMIIILGTIIDTFVAYNLVKEIYPSATFPGVGIAKLIFLFLGLLLALIGSFLLNSYYNEDKAGGFFAGACVCLLICCIIAFTSMDSESNGLTIAATVFLLLSTILGFVEFINSYGNSAYKTSSSYHPTYKSTYTFSSSSSSSTPSSTSSSNTSGDAETQLRKLKSLFDDGVITAEEYEEKRKKYIDKL